MMMFDRLAHQVGVGDGANDLRAHMRVHLHLLKFVLTQRPRFVQDALGNENFADVMHAGGVYQVRGLLRRLSQGARDHFGIARHEIAMAGGLQLARLGASAQGLDRFFHRRRGGGCYGWGRGPGDRGRRSASTWVRRGPVQGIRPMNSAPPYRATTFDCRDFCSSRRPTRASTRSPSKWPMVSLTSLNLSRSMSTTENGRPEREARFHSAERASQKKRRGLVAVWAQGVECRCRFLQSAGHVPA